MPDTKFSWARVREHFRKTFWIYLIGCLVMVLLSDILFTATRPRTPDENCVKFYMVDATSDSEALDGMAQALLAQAQPEDETILEVAFETVAFTDTESDYYSSMVLMTRMAVGDGDIYMTNRSGFDYMCASEALLPLDDMVEAGWLKEYNLNFVSFTNSETGESHIYGIAMDDMDCLAEMGGFNNEGALLGLGAGSTNPDSSRLVLERFVEMALGGGIPAAEAAQP